MVYVIKAKEDLETKLTEAGGNLVVIDFYATWCGPCKAIAPKFQELSEKHPDVVFLKVDVDENEDIAVEYDVKAMPTFIFIKSKAKVDSFVGANVEELTKMLLKLK